MPCLHLYSDLFLRLSSRFIIVFCLALYVLPLGAEGAQPQNVSLEFPVFNSSMFTCTGIPSIVAYPYCAFNTSGEERAWVSVLPPTYNNLYPNQAARMTYKTPISFRNADSSIIADWSTFIIFRVEHVPKQVSLGSGLAFLIAPEIDTPDDSASGGFGLFSMDPSTGLPVSGTDPMVIAVEFDTQMTAGIDVLSVPHIGIDLNSLVSVNASYLGTEVFDTGIGIWVDYNNTLKTLAVYYALVDATDGSATEFKPPTPTISLVNFSSVTYMNQQAYIGISAGVFSGGFEVNKVVYWTFKTFGFPAPVVVATWYQWWRGVSATKKVGLVAGAAVGTILGAYACSECLFFCFFQRIKNPATAAEQRWPVRRRTSLPGTKPKSEPPPRRKVRDSLSVAKPLDLWSAPPGADGEPAVDFSNRPESDLKAMAEFDDSSDEGFGDPELNLDQNWDEHALDPAAVDQSWDEHALDPAAPEEEEVPPATDGEIWEEAPPQGETESSPAEEKAGPPVDMPESPEKKPQETGTDLGMKTNSKDAPLIEKKSSQVEKEVQAPNASKVPPGAVNPSSTKQTSPEKPGAAPGAKPGSPPQQRPPQAGTTAVAPQAEKPGSEPQQRPSQAGKTVASPGAPQETKPGTPLQERPSQAGKTVVPQAAKLGSLEGTPQAAKPGLPPQGRPSQAGKTVVPQAAKPGSAEGTPQAAKPDLPPQERPSQAGKTVVPQAAKPGSPPQDRPSQAGKTVAPQAVKPGSPHQDSRPPQAGKTVAPQATKPGSPPAEKPSPVDKKMAPQATKPDSPEASKPGSPTQERPTPAGKSLAPQATKPGSPPAEKPSPVDKKMVPQATKPGSPEAAKPGSSTQERPSSPGKSLASQATKPGSEPQHKPSPVDKTTARQEVKSGSQPEQQKLSQPVKTAAPQSATKPGSPPMPGPWQGEKAKPEAGPQKVAPQAVIKTPPPAGATPAPQKSPPQGPGGPSQVPRKELPKAPRPSPQTSPPKAASPQTSPKAPPRPTPQSPPKK